ncbi:MAG: sigma-70 family RNA polymerase sigma factor [Anaeromyxobacteraceae bacterium]
MKDHKRHLAADELASYFATVRKLPKLSREEEHGLAIEARGGDVIARQRLVRHSLGFVVAIARKLTLGTVRLDDVIQEGNLGLVRATETFDPNVGTRFETYAVWWIRANIGKYLKEARSIVRPRGGTNALADVSLDVSFDQDDDSTRLDRVEDDGPGPEDTFLTNAAIRALGATR